MFETVFARSANGPAASNREPTKGTPVTESLPTTSTIEEVAASVEQILVERRDNVLLLTLNRPERLNAWTHQMTRELTRAIVAANDDPRIGAIVVTGAGRGFCAGADIGSEFASQLDRTTDATAPVARRSVDWVKLCRSSKPLIAAINGPAVGIGLTLVLPFDRIIAGAAAKISLRFVRMGIVPELASSRFAVARCGWGAASWLALSGNTITGEEAGRINLVDLVVADDQVLIHALADAKVLAANPIPQMRMIKELFSENATESDTDLVQRRELAALQIAFKTPEHREAVNAFIEKRPPDFRNV